MIIVYTSVPAICLVMALIFKNYKKDLFKNLDNKEHPLRFLYPAAARVLDLTEVIYPRKSQSNVSSLMKQLCVRENVETEVYIYNVRKFSSLTGIMIAVCMVGMLLFITQSKDTVISTLIRPDSGQTSYQLDVEYGETSETIELTLDAAEMTEEEIHEKFEENIEGIRSAILGDNPSLNEVSLPLNLITEYGSIEIEWEIPDISLINYNGEVSKDVSENEYIPLDLFATLSIGDIAEVYCIPVVLTGESVSSKELLIRNIYESIENNNSEYDSEVALPENINGVSLVFREINNNADRVFFALGAVAVVLLIFAYDRTLENKLKARREELAMDFTEIVFKLCLLYEAGLSIQKAWERIVTEYENTKPKKPHFAYREMRLTLEQIKNGSPEAAAYGQFGKRCGLHQYMKLGSILEQNLTKGSRGMKALLRSEAQDSFEERKRLARKKGEEAGTKLMIPMIMMLVIVLVIIALPAVMSIRF